MASKNQMKIALVHDDLIQFGGAEKLLLKLTEMFPEATVFTSVASKKWQKVLKDKNIKLKTSFMQKLPKVEKYNRYYSPFLFHVLAFESFDFSGFDYVISISARYAHGIITRPPTKHICYMNSPGRMFWEPDSYFENEDFGPFKKIRSIARPFLSLPLSHLRLWDYSASKRIDFLIANSKTPQDRIKKYYRQDSYVIYPFVEFDKFVNLEKNSGDYYVVLTRLVSWKRVDIAIKACNKLNLPLKVLSDGPDRKRLEEMAGPTVEFLGRVSDEEKGEIFANAKALINTQSEDFGIVPLEAMASGTPVIAYGRGGVLETVVEGSTGEFFYEQSEQSLSEVLKKFNPEKYDPYVCRSQAKLFSEKEFEDKIKSVFNCV